MTESKGRFYWSDDDSSSHSDEDLAPSASASATTTVAPTRGLLEKLSDSENEEKRVVKSAKDKRVEELQAMITSLKNSCKINDVCKVADISESLVRTYTKYRSVLEKDIASMPRFYVKILIDIEEFANSLWEDRAKLSKNHAKALATLRQRHKKYMKEIQPDVEAYKRLSVSSGEETPVRQLSPIDDKQVNTITSDVTNDVVYIDNENNMNPQEISISDNVVDEEYKSDTDTWPSGSESSDDTESDTPERQLTAKHFLKSYTARQTLSKKATTSATAAGDSSRKPKNVKQKVGTEDGQDKIIDTKTLLFAPKEEITIKKVLEKEDKILKMRGRRNVDTMVLLDQLNRLRNISDQEQLGHVLSVRLLLKLLATVFDLKTSGGSLRTKEWELALGFMTSLLEILVTYPDTKIFPDNQAAEGVEDEVIIVGNPQQFIERLNDAFFSILRNTDHNIPAYLDRLRDDFKLHQISLDMEKYLTLVGEQPLSFARLYVCRLEHLYYKTAGLLSVTLLKDNLDSPHSVINNLREFILSCNNPEQPEVERKRAILFHIYYLAINDEWNKARNLMLSSHIQDTLMSLDRNTQILYNRTLTQIGLCAFRFNHLDISHEILLDLISSARLKEHLAQGFNQRTLDPDKELVAHQYLVPYHMHINLELVECVYMTAAMLKEVTYMTSKELETKKRLISRIFHNQLKNREKQLIVGPPDQSKDYVIAGAYAMRDGDWRLCCQHVLNIRVWSLFSRQEEIKQMLTERIKEATLETFLYGFSYIYTSISLSQLATNFELPENAVHRIVSRLIGTGKLQASLDESTRTIAIHNTRPNELQLLSLKLSEKLELIAQTSQDLAKFKQVALPGQEFQNRKYQSQAQRNQD